ncbi:MAG: CHC2 zinc finger domain-containing protein [Lysobacteraceae bacterium]
MTAHEKAPAVASSRGSEAVRFGQAARRHPTADPVALLLDRLDNVRRAGRGWTARCPAHQDRTASLSVSEGDGGKVLLHCFAGCPAHDVVAAVGLELSDLFPVRLAPATPEQRREAARWARESRWAAALRVLSREATLVLAAAGMLEAGPLAAEDRERLAAAVARINDARGVLA